MRVVTRKGTEGTPIVSRASISSLIRMVPNSATRPQPTLAPIAKAKNVLVVEQCQNGWRIQVLERLDPNEAPDDARVHRARHALGAPLGAYTFIYADGSDERAEQNALDLAAEEVDQRALGKEARQERARVDAHHRHRDEEAGQRCEDDHGDVVERRHYHQRQGPRHDDEENVGESHHAQRLELLANLAGA